MTDISIDYASARAQKARIGHAVNPQVRIILWSVIIALIVAGVAGLVAKLALGWFVISLASIPYMILQWHRHELYHLPTGKDDSATSRLSGDVLGQLPKKPSPVDFATAAARVQSGQFMAARFGLSANLLQSVAAKDPNLTKDLLEACETTRQRLSIEHINGAIIAASLLRLFPERDSLLANMHLDDDDLDKGILWQQHLRELVAKHNAPKRTGGIARDWSFGYVPLLTRFGQNISEQIGRGGGLLTVDVKSHTEAIDQLIDTFGTGGRQNAVLVGGAGAGKTTIIHAFAERLLDASAHVPESLRFRQVFILDSSSLIAAAPGRGELEQLIMRVLGEAYTAKNIIICLDNAQLFFEEGIGAVDLSNVLQPILDAGRLRVILSMDEQRFMQIGKRNPALINSLNRINVPASNQEETLIVMQEQLIATEIQRHVTYMYQSLKEAYRLSERYVHDLAQPGRAIKLLESAASYNESGFVTINSVQQAIEKTLDVKVSIASQADDREKLLNMENLIHKRMVNQTRAVSVVSDALRRARAGVRNPNRPIGTFLFLGPTGVGKTELSKALADVYFGGEARMIRLDLNEFVRAEDVARLIADGADDPSSLTAQVMKQPFSVVLLDEIEKAAPEVLSTLLQVLDEGILRDVKNREVSFRDAIIVATSNAGADRIREYIERGYKLEQFEQDFVNELISSNQFRPEFLNRFDEIVLFRPFTKEELIEVCNLILASVNKTLSLQKVSVEVDEEAKKVLVNKGYDPRLGARPMRRVVQKAVENTVAKKMLSGTVAPGDVIRISKEEVETILGTEQQANAIAEQNSN
jgi:ATP-dependent Clp protease ATP-binding subunit ClpC